MAHAGSPVSEKVQQQMRLTGLIAGPFLFFVTLFWLHPADMSASAIRVMSITIWISVWWVTEAVPLPVTSLLPIVLFPLMKIMKMDEATIAYGHPLIFLYVGGFLLAIAIEKSGLHARIAFSIIRAMGSKLSFIVLGFMLATGFLSMWISNTATAVMMLPIGLSILAMCTGNEVYFPAFSKSLMLSIAYGASIGGVATVIGTPPNVVFAGIVRDTLGREISFLDWFMVGLPLALILMFFAWWYMTHIAFPLQSNHLPSDEKGQVLAFRASGKMTGQEKKVAVVFALMAFAWITRSFLLSKWIPGIDDTMIAMAGGVALFLIPSRRESIQGILTWEDAIKLPWGIILLFGGGMALAEAFEVSGLAAWIGQSLTGLSALGTFFIILLSVAVVNLLTEFTSNLATVTMILPVLIPMAQSTGIPPLVLMTGATMAASYGFMMPAGTPPNAIAFGSGYLRIGDMIRTGVVLNLISVVVISLIAYFVLEKVWAL